MGRKPKSRVRKLAGGVTFFASSSPCSVVTDSVDRLGGRAVAGAAVTGAGWPIGSRGMGEPDGTAATDIGRSDSEGTDTAQQRRGRR